VNKKKKHQQKVNCKGLEKKKRLLWEERKGSWLLQSKRKGKSAQPFSIGEPRGKEEPLGPLGVTMCNGIAAKRDADGEGRGRMGFPGGEKKRQTRAGRYRPV